MNAVEDELTDIPYNPASWQTDGRLYPPLPDNARRVPDRPDLVRHVSRGHDTVIRSNGALLIRHRRTENVIFERPGADGARVHDE